MYETEYPAKLSYHTRDITTCFYQYWEASCLSLWFQ